MATYHESPNMSQARSRFRSKEYLYAVLAALLVLAFVFYSREGSGILPAAPAPITPNEQQLPLPIDKTVADTTKKPSTSDPLIDEVGLDVFPPTKSPVSSSSSSSSSSSGGSKSGSSSSTTGSGNNNALTSDVPAADRPQAIIIESDIVPNLVPLMLHFATVLGPAWGMILFTTKDRWVEPLSPAFQRLRADHRIEVRFLPPGTELTSSAAVSRFLTSPWIWEQLQAARRVLLFQSDSVLCAKSEARVEDYFAYDLVGAPIAAVYGQGYNGGLSLRNPRLFLQVVRETDFAASGQEFEDQFFYGELLRRGAALPGEDVAKTFSVETIYYETPLGYHQPQRWQAGNMAAIEEWCPEVKMLIGRRAQ